MYEIAEQVLRWQAEGRSAWLVRVIDTAGISSRDRAPACGYSPGRPLAGSLFSGAADDVLAERLAGLERSCVITLPVSETAAARVGLSCGGSAQLLVEPVSAISGWQLLADGRPLCLVTDLTEPITTRAYQLADLPRSATPDGREAEIGRLFKRGISQTRLLAEPAIVVTALWPAVRVFVVGGGLIADALAANGALLDWPVTVLRAVTDEVLTAADSVIVLEHDLDVSGTALTAALASPARYVGALGSRHTQTARADWLAEHGVTQSAIERIHGPAGLDIGSRTPAEIALSILAEIMQVRSTG
jgi:xanthine dehydrogenase accessory factor